MVPEVKAIQEKHQSSRAVIPNENPDKVGF